MAKNEIPEAPKNADQIDTTLKPIDNQGGFITFSWLSPLIKRIRKQKAMYHCDIFPLSDPMKAYPSGVRLAQQWNESVRLHKATKKPMRTLLAQIFRMNKSKMLWLFLFVPLTSLCNISSPIALRQFTKILTPQSFYDCSTVFLSDPHGVPTFQPFSYSSGIKYAFEQLWGFLILVAVSQFCQVAFQNMSFSVLSRSAVSGVSGLLDLIFQKILVISDQARANSAAGNLVNLLYTDTQKIAMMLTFLHMIIEVPFDVTAFIIYLGVQITPIAMTGLLAYFVLFPIIGIIVGKMMFFQKKVMSLRDMRIKRASEILNGVKVVKLFSIEAVQLARLQNARNKELSMVFKNAMCMSFFMTVATIAAPLMTVIAFIALTLTGKFDLASAFTTMYLFQYLAMAIVMLPMLASVTSEAMISSGRLTAFLQLPEQDPGFVVKTNDLTVEQLKQIPKLDENLAIKIEGNPTFTWSLAKDKDIPPILDPFYKENIATMKQMNAKFPSLMKEYNLLLVQLPAQPQAAQVTISVASEDKVLADSKIKSPQQINMDEVNELRNLQLDQPMNEKIADRWCIEFDLPEVSRLASLEQYNFVGYLAEKGDSLMAKLKKLYLHIWTIKIFRKKQSNQGNTDSPNILKNISFEVKKGEIIGMCGQVGTGKSSLFNAILGEMRLCKESVKDIDPIRVKNEGAHEISYDYIEKQTLIEEDPRFDLKIPHIYIQGSISYFSQSPHIFSRTARENILYGKKYEEEKYNKVIKMCCLEDDFKIFPGGDLTEIGGKGVTLSGGQKARVALARAVYSDADIVLLDDPLSAVDAHVGKTIWTEAVMGYLKGRGKTVIIASHQTQYFNDCDRVMQIVDGEIANFDTVQNLIKKGVNILGITGERTEHEDSKVTLGDKAVVQETKDAKKKQEDGKMIKAEQQSGTGNVKFSTYKKWMMAGSLPVAIIMVFLLCMQTGVAQYQTILISDWASDEYNWSSAECDRTCLQDILSKITVSGCEPGANHINTSYCVPVTGPQQLMYLSLNRTTLEPINKYAFQIINKCVTEYGATLNMPEIPTSKKYLYLYIGLTILSASLSYAGNVALLWFCLSIAKRMHNTMLQCLLRTTMSFYDTTPQGRILNRMSKDTDSLDANISRFIQASIWTFLMIIGMIISIACVNWPCLLIIIPSVILFVVIFMVFRMVFPQIKRIETITRSPVFGICQESVDSLVSIRAFGLSKMLTNDFRTSCDVNMSVFFQQFAMVRWVFFRLGMICVCFAVCVALIAIFLSPVSDSIANYTGVIVSYAFSITWTLLQFVITLVSLEGEMPSVERILEYSNLPSEGELVKADKEPGRDWPKQNGVVEVKNLEFKYRPELEPVLNRISFKLNPKEHVGIVGRTGAGKSSITVAMYRLAEPQTGSEIIVDGVNILELGLHQSRRAFTIIPQDPFLFSGTLRQSLCPFSQAEAEGVRTDGITRLTDDQIWEVLQHVQLKKYFQEQPGGLDSKIAMNGDNLSAGQKQLVCVARALLRKASCVILDEATACVDRETDQLIQETIRTALAEVTVLSIAHRIDTIIDFDRIIVMDKGNIAEFDTPAELIRKGGLFLELVDKTGGETSQKLKDAAFLAEKQRKAGEKVTIIGFGKQ